ncbi:coiled-coil domain-containing protein 130 [Cryptococcus neoformans Ze90-1]|nr:coiled-coil domain-containing protein 130 [Cryptococcus neoformans var. grubii Ze90-1]
MQGFNRYVPPDYDPKKASTLNLHQGKKHALGKRAKDIDKGILVVRFELPFNIWCGTCGAHIGAGVRYNAQKRKVGNYYSTPIWAFRCKCHLCSGWFEIRTDPKNAAYVVEEGAKKKDEDWDPEEHGGFRIHDTEAPSASDTATADPIAHLEKTIDQQEWAKKGTSRLTELTRQSARLSADPYAVSAALRKKFREEKKVMIEKQDRDDAMKERYGLGEDVDLGDEAVEGGREEWKAGRIEKGLHVPGSSTFSVKGVDRSIGQQKGIGKGRLNDSPAHLAEVLRKSTAKKYNPFDSPVAGFGSPSSSSTLLEGLGARARMKEMAIPRRKKSVEGRVVNVTDDSSGDVSFGLLSGYGSD